MTSATSTPSKHSKPFLHAHCATRASHALHGEIDRFSVFQSGLIHRLYHWVNVTVLIVVI